MLETVVVVVNQYCGPFQENNTFYDPGSKEPNEPSIYNIVNNDTIQLINKPEIRNPFLVRAAMFEDVVQKRLGRKEVNKLFDEHLEIFKNKP